MKSFQEVVDLLNKLDVNKIIDSIMGASWVHKEIIELNQIEQLNEGVDALDQKIISLTAEDEGQGNVYAFNTIIEKKISGQQTHAVNLKDSGRFWETFKVIKITGGWNIIASFGLYGGTIEDNFDKKYDFLGLTPDNLDWFVFNILLPELDKRIRQQLKI